MINLFDALTGDITRLRYIVRFSNCLRQHDESVAEHSYFTAFYAMLMAMEHNRSVPKKERVDMGQVLTQALMHDVDEHASGDFIRMFKHSNPALVIQINQACGVFMESFVNQLAEDPELREELWDSWHDSKEGVAGQFVAFADFLSVASYIHQEIISGNLRMRQQVPELRKFFEGFTNEKKYPALTPFLSRAYELIGELVRRSNA